MSLRRETPCDCDGICPYSAEYNGDCEYWCGADEPVDELEVWEEEENEEERESEMRTVEIYFSDLNEAAQKRMLEAVGVESPADMNWDMDIIPIATVDFEVEDED